MQFFERKKSERGEWPTTFQRDSFPRYVRIQCWQIFHDSFNHTRSDSSRLYAKSCEAIVKGLRLSIGIQRLAPKSNPYDNSYSDELHAFFLNGLPKTADLQNQEYAFSVLENICNHLSDEEIAEINRRLRLAGIGFKFVEEILVPDNEELLIEHSTAPAISILNREEFRETYDYIKEAYADYKQGTPQSFQSAIDNTQKALESLLKIIFDELKIEYGPKATYMPLLQIAQEKGLFPQIAQDKLIPLINAMKGLGEIRNVGGGHGGADSKANDRLVRLALNHATSNILFIAESYLEEYKK